MLTHVVEKASLNNQCISELLIKWMGD